MRWHICWPDSLAVDGEQVIFLGSLFHINGLLHIPVDAVLCQFDYRTLQIRFYLNIIKVFLQSCLIYTNVT